MGSYENNDVGVKLIAIAHVWSQRGMSYFMSAFGSTKIHDDKHLTSFEDDLDNVTHKEINLSSACHNSHEFLSSMCEYNREGQSFFCFRKKVYDQGLAISSKHCSYEHVSC